MLNFDDKAYEHFMYLVNRLKIGFSVEDMLEIIDVAMVVLSSIFRQGRDDQINSLILNGKIGSYYDKDPKSRHYKPLAYEDLLRIVITDRVPWKFVPLLFEESDEGYITRNIINLLLDFNEDGTYAEDIFRQAFKRISFLHPPLKCNIRPLTIEDLQTCSNIMYLCFGQLFNNVYSNYPPDLMYISLRGLAKFVGGGILNDMECYFRVRVTISDVQRLAKERFLNEYNHESSMQEMYKFISSKDRYEFVSGVSMDSPEITTSSPRTPLSEYGATPKINRHHAITSMDEGMVPDINEPSSSVKMPASKRSNRTIVHSEYLTICKDKCKPLCSIIKQITNEIEKSLITQKH